MALRIIRINTALALKPWGTSTPAYNTLLRSSSKQADGVYFNATSTEQLQLNARITSRLYRVMYIVSNGLSTTLTFAADYGGDPFRFRSTNGTWYTGTFPLTSGTTLSFPGGGSVEPDPDPDPEPETPVTNDSPPSPNNDQLTYTFPFALT